MATQTGSTTAAGRLDGHSLSMAGLGGGHAQHWGGTGAGSGSEQAPCPTTTASAASTSVLGARISASARGEVGGGMRYDGGCGDGLAEGCHATNDHVRQYDGGLDLLVCTGHTAPDPALLLL